MKYFLRFVACLPALGVGLSAILCFIVAFDYKWAILLCITNIIGFIYLLDNIENITRNLINMLRALCDKTLCDKI